VHAFCHAIPDRWHQMGVLLSAASALSWWAGVAGHTEVELLSEIRPGQTTDVFFAPYLSGERTPHNDTAIRAGFAGLDAAHTRADMTLAVLEGVAYAMRDAQLALAGGGTRISDADLLGGGTRSPHWCQLMGDVLGIPLHRVTQSDVGCAVGAARLAAMAAAGGGADIVAAIATRPERLETYTPDVHEVARHHERHAQWQSMYPMSKAFRTSLT
jgi:xylulokinase